MSEAIVKGHWNVPWLRDLPASWQVVSSKRLFAARKELARPDDEQLAATQAYGVIFQKEFERRVGRRVVQITQNLEKRRHVERNDFVISMRSFEGGLERAWETGCIRSSYVVLKPSAEVDVGYFQYLFKSHDYIQALRATSNFIRDGQDLNISNFSLVDLPLPPLDDQRLIARFLDWHGAQTAKLIRAKKKIIALLNEQKQAIIHRAVTRGLDPNVRLKPSGISWLGDVPEGWDVAALRHRYDQCLGKMLDAKRITGAYLIPYLRNTDVQWERINVVNLPLMDVPPDEYARYCVRLGDLLVCEGGEIGRAAIWSNALELCAFQKALHRLRPRNLKRDNPQFLLLQLRLAVALGAFVDGHESTIAHLTGEKLRAHRFVFPSLVEQQRIISHIETQSVEINAAADRVEREIALIQEFRTRLIADVVTGKLDIRAAAASLLDVAELEAADDLAEDDDLDELIDDAESAEVAA